MKIIIRYTKEVLDKIVAIKQKYFRSNHSPFLDKQVLKAIMDRSRLQNKFLKSRKIIDKLAYNKQRNPCLSLVRKTKKK